MMAAILSHPGGDGDAIVSRIIKGTVFLREKQLFE
jgi:hypothetical protein